MTGTLVNAAGIALGAVAGVLLKKRIPVEINDSILKAEGIGIFLIGLCGVLASMFQVDTVTGKLGNSGGLLLLVSLVLGCATGEFLHIDDHICAFGDKIGGRFGTSGFSKGFVSASLVFCIGAMAIIGALNEGLTGDPSTLYIKSALDFTTAVVLSSTLGIGVLFSAIPVVILQGSVTLLAGFLAPYIADALLDSFCMVGYTLVLVIGLNFVAGTNVKVANLLPAMVVPVIWHFVPR